MALRPFEPLAFSGDWRTTATAVHGPSRDFNVMTARALPLPQVQVVRKAARLEPPSGGMLAVYAPMANRLTLSDEALSLDPAEPVLAVVLAL